MSKPTTDPTQALAYLDRTVKRCEALLSLNPAKADATAFGQKAQRYLAIAKGDADVMRRTGTIGGLFADHYATIANGETEPLGADIDGPGIEAGLVKLMASNDPNALTAAGILKREFSDRPHLVTEAVELAFAARGIPFTEANVRAAIEKGKAANAGADPYLAARAQADAKGLKFVPPTITHTFNNPPAGITQMSKKLTTEQRAETRAQATAAKSPANVTAPASDKPARPAITGMPAGLARFANGIKMPKEGAAPTAPATLANVAGIAAFAQAVGATSKTADVDTRVRAAGYVSAHDVAKQIGKPASALSHLGANGVPDVTLADGSQFFTATRAAFLVSRFKK